ncbi:MAG: tetratricopeptide repeat protein [Spirochaetaceae bacterium]|jgi:tetratricopeptide (TPR) repeat protein|nr:tetratricopeptide repeat protein [Spirochaetaceae bacterium]
MKGSCAGPVIFLFAAVLLTSCNGENPNEETMLLYSRASSSYAQGNFTEAASMLGPIKHFTPALVLRAKALYFNGQGDQALVLLRRALRRNPGSGEASLFLARILREQGKDQEALDIIEVLLRDNPQDLRALRIASDLAALAGNTGDAAALLDRAVEASAETALVFIDRAKLRWTAGNGSGALEDLRRAEVLLPWNTPLVRGLRDLRSVLEKDAEEKNEAK